MSDTPSARCGGPQGLSSDFWKFWFGQTVSNLGSSITLFAMPLLVFQLTGSALNLGLTAAIAWLPNLLFGLVIGAWVDRVDRRRLMITVDLLQGVAIVSVPLHYHLDLLTLWWIYIVVFVHGLMTVIFQAAEFAAIPSLVDRADLVTANGRIQASYSAAMVVGPLLAGFIPVADLLLIDVASFLVSGTLLALVRRSFNGELLQQGGARCADAQRAAGDRTGVQPLVLGRRRALGTLYGAG